MKKTLVAMMGALVLGLPAWSQPPASTPVVDPGFPAPSVLLDPQAVSIGVVQAHPDDVGFRELFKTAWEALKNRTGSDGSFLDMITTFLSRTTQENILLGFLPFQAVRIDHFDEQGNDRASFMVSLAGFKGIQGLFYGTLLNGPDGKPYPTERINGETVVVRVKPGNPPEEAPVVARVNGTFYSFANLAIARRVLEGKANNPGLAKVLAGMNPRIDTYGVLLNREETLLKFLSWVNKRDFESVRQKVGSDRLTAALRDVQTMSWQGDLISDDRMDMQVRFRASSPEKAEELEEVVGLARDALAAKGRATDLQITVVDQDVLVETHFTGYKKMLTDYLK